MLELWREFDLMPPQQMVLGLLSEPKPMGELAQQMHCDSSNITGIVDRLEERGLVRARSRRGRPPDQARRADRGRDGDARRARPAPHRAAAELAALSQAELRKLRDIFPLAA